MALDLKFMAGCNCEWNFPDDDAAPHPLFVALNVLPAAAAADDAAAAAPPLAPAAAPAVVPAVDPRDLGKYKALL